MFRRPDVHRIWIGETDYHWPRVCRRVAHVQLRQSGTTEHRGHIVFRVRDSRTRLRTFPFGYIRNRHHHIIVYYLLLLLLLLSSSSSSS